MQCRWLFRHLLLLVSASSRLLLDRPRRQRQQQQEQEQEQEQKRGRLFPPIPLLLRCLIDAWPASPRLASLAASLWSDRRPRLRGMAQPAPPCLPPCRSFFLSFFFRGRCCGDRAPKEEDSLATSLASEEEKGRMLNESFFSCAPSSPPSSPPCLCWKKPCFQSRRALVGGVLSLPTNSPCI